MYIEKYTAHIKDNLTKKSFKIVVDENSAQDAHQKIFNKINNFQDIEKIFDHSNNLVFDLNIGFAA